MSQCLFRHEGARMKNVKSKNKNKTKPETRKQKKPLKDDFNLYGFIYYLMSL